MARRKAAKQCRSLKEKSETDIDLTLVLSSDDDDSDFSPSESDSEEDVGLQALAVISTTSSSEGEEPVRPRKVKGKAKLRKKNSKNEGEKMHEKIVEELNWEKWEKGLDDWPMWTDDGEIDLDALVRNRAPLKTQEPSSDLLMPLLPFQKEWLAWSLNQEVSESKGGILADEMGMGKTIQAISLVLTSRALKSIQPPGTSKSKQPMKTENAAMKEIPHIKTTLVICPLVAVIQWRNEIERFTAKGSAKVLIYHGHNRCKTAAELAQYDIVLTTYSIVQVEYSKNTAPAKAKCEWCGKLFKEGRLVVHQRYYCGPNAKRTVKQSKQQKKGGKSQYNAKKQSVSEQEDSDFEADVPSKKKAKTNSKQPLKTGNSRMRAKKVGNANGRKRKVVFNEGEDTTDGSNDGPQSQADGSNDGQQSQGPSSSLLHSVEWERIILDEAHAIKDRRCSTSKAVFALKSSYKWALSGTPLQNRVGELYSLVRFLQIFPYSYYFCKKCDCQSLDYSFGKNYRECDHCGHSPLSHFCWWNKFVANPIKNHGYSGPGRKALILLKYKVLDQIVLRRTKLERAADLALPPRIIFLRRDAFDSREEDFYQAMYTQSQSQFNTYIQSGTLLNNYAHIFDLLTRLRQAVDHPYLVVYSKTSNAHSSAPKSTTNPSTAVDECAICHDLSDDPVTASCGHMFCRECIAGYTTSSGPASCPSCAKPLTIDFTGGSEAQNQKAIKTSKRYSSSILNRINLKDFQTSTKIDALREEITLMLQRDAAAKAIVFSQFTSFLDLISFSLVKSGIKCVHLNGSMNIQARDKTIEQFSKDPDCKIFLMSLKAGGVALNLTVASHVFLMDPWWNPAVEQQAQDRIHRLGQYKPIRVVRFVIANTIEERILKLQEKKQLVFEGTVGGSSEAFGKLTVDDLRFLFTV